jgi:hypothetical protein
MKNLKEISHAKVAQAKAAREDLSARMKERSNPNAANEAKVQKDPSPDPEALDLMVPDPEALDLMVPDPEVPQNPHAAISGSGAKDASVEIARIARIAKTDDNHGILGVARDATRDALKDAYKTLVKLLHPDKCSP